MKSESHGNGTSPVELLGIFAQGFRLSVSGRELYLPFKDFPWFRDAKGPALANVSLVGPDHLYWPDLDVDLSVESIEHPDRFPLVSEPAPKYEAESRDPDAKG